MKSILSLITMCLFLSCAFAGKITVVLPVKSSMTEKTAAKELQTLMKKTSKVSIVKEGAKTSGKVIYVGNTAMAEKYKAVKKFDGDEWLIRAIDGNRIILNGGRRGVIYAGYELLERLGGLMFLEQFTVYGPEKEPVWNKNYRVSGKSPFAWRSLYSYFSPDVKGRHLWSMRSRQNFFLNERLRPYMKEHGLSPFFGRPRANHTFYYYTREWKNVPDEYFALSPRNGKRERATGPSGPGQICFTHPEVRKLFAKQLEQFIKQDMADYKDVPPPVYYAISPNDNNYPCVCPNCKAAVKKLGNYTGLVIDFANYLARSVAKKYPHVRLKISAYLFAQNPPVPGTKIEKNILPGLAQMGMEWEDFSSFTRTKRESLLPLNHPINAKAYDEFKKWASFNKLSTWDYWITWQDRGYLTDNCEAVKENLKIYDGKAEIVFGEIEDPLRVSFHPLRMYLIHRLWSDPSRNADQEIERFMNAYYGKAAKEMKAVRALILAENKSLKGKLTIPTNMRKGLNAQYFAKAEKLFNAALAKARGDKTLTRRIKHQRICFDRVRLLLPNIPADLAPGSKAVAKRMLADYNEVADLFLSGSGRRRQTEEMMRAAQGPEFVTTPVKEFPGRKVIAHFRGNSFPKQYKVTIAKDPDSATGNAVYHPNNGMVDEGIRFGFCDLIDKKSVARRLNKKQFKFDGKYHWYRIGEVILTPSCYVYAHKTWEIQRRLHGIYNMAPGNRVEIFIKLKAQMDKKNPRKVDKLWADGVLLLEPKDKKIPFIKGFEGKKVVARFDKIRAQYKVKRVADKDSTSGSALVRVVNDPISRGIRIGYYDISSKKSWNRTFNAKTFKFDGKYHWYSAGVAAISKNGYAHVHLSTEFQCRLDTAASRLPGGIGEVIFRLKAELDASKKVIKKIYLDSIAVLAVSDTVVKELPGRKIITVYDANDITAQYKVKKVADKDAVAGKALKRAVNDSIRRGIRLAYYDITNKKTHYRTFTGKNLKADGKYHWYILKNIRISPRGYAHTHFSCEFQKHLGELLKNFNCKEADLAFRIKVTLDPAKKMIKEYYLDSIAILEKQ